MNEDDVTLRLPNEIWLKIIQYCFLFDKISLKKVNHRFFSLVPFTEGEEKCLNGRVSLPPKSSLRHAKEEGINVDFDSFGNTNPMGTNVFRCCTWTTDSMRITYKNRDIDKEKPFFAIVPTNRLNRRLGSWIDVRLNCTQLGINRWMLTKGGGQLQLRVAGTGREGAMMQTLWAFNVSGTKNVDPMAWLPGLSAEKFGVTLRFSIPKARTEELERERRMDKRDLIFNIRMKIVAENFTVEDIEIRLVFPPEPFTLGEPSRCGPSYQMSSENRNLTIKSEEAL